MLLARCPTVPQSPSGFAFVRSRVRALWNGAVRLASTAARLAFIIRKNESGIPHENAPEKAVLENAPMPYSLILELPLSVRRESLQKQLP
jgi:hypothetical protein